MKIDIEKESPDMTAYVRESQVDEVQDWAREHDVKMLLMGAFGDMSSITSTCSLTGTVYVGTKWGVYFPKISPPLRVMFKLRFGGDV